MDRNVEEAMCDLQAQLHVQGLALRALAATHPDPEALLAEWRQRLGEAEVEPIAVRERDSAYLRELCRVHVEDWTAELVELALPKLDAGNVDVPKSSVVPLRRPDRTPPS